jgi:hypothetical protein
MLVYITDIIIIILQLHSLLSANITKDRNELIFICEVLLFSVVHPGTHSEECYINEKQ